MELVNLESNNLITVKNKIVDYDLIIDSVKKDEVIVEVRSIYKTNWKISNIFGKIRTAFWFTVPFLPIIIYIFSCLYWKEYLYLFWLPVIYLILTFANPRLTIFPLIFFAIFLFGGLISDTFFETKVWIVFITTLISFILLIMAQWNVLTDVIDKAVLSKELFAKLYDDEMINIHEKSSFYQ